MHLAPEIARTHPGFAQWLRIDFSGVLDDQSVLGNFTAIAGLSEARSRAYVKGGLFTPMLVLADLGSSSGRFYPNKPLMVFIHRRIADAVEENVDDRRPRLFAEAKILHELVHCAQQEALGAQPISDIGDDPGARFELAVYGAGPFGLEPQDYLAARYRYWIDLMVA